MNENVKVIGLEQLLGSIFGGPQEAPEPEKVHSFPSITGPAGRAWQADLSVLREAAVRRNQEITRDTVVASWIIERVGALPYAHSFVVTLVSLDHEDAQHWLEGSTHEFSVFPLAPNVSRDDMLSGEQMIPMLGQDGPVFAAQIIATDHNHAVEQIAERVVQAVCNGDLIPSHDEDEAWIKVFGDASVDPRHAEAERAQKAADRYHEAMKGLEVASAYAAAKEPRNVEPSYLRNGVDSVQISITALSKLLIDRGIISQADYVEAVSEAAVNEYGVYASRLGLPPLSFQLNDEAADGQD